MASAAGGVLRGIVRFKAASGSYFNGAITNAVWSSSKRATTVSPLLPSPTLFAITANTRSLKICSANTPLISPFIITGVATNAAIAPLDGSYRSKSEILLFKLSSA